MTTVDALLPHELYRVCNLQQFDFETTDELDDLVDAIAQPRAIEALNFGLGIKQTGFNVFALGPMGGGKRSVIKQILTRKAEAESVAMDCCYVYNFDSPSKPRIIILAPGLAVSLQRDMVVFLTELQFKILTAKVWGDTQKNRFAVAFIDQQVATLRQSYVQSQDALDYFDGLKKDLINHLDAFRQLNEAHNRRYHINVVIDHGNSHGAPVVFENDPTYERLVGHIEQQGTSGVLTRDFTGINVGALHRANHGYLVVEAERLLQHPESWIALKRALRLNEVLIESASRRSLDCHSLMPEPMPLSLKVVLVGDRGLYYSLHQSDPDFRTLFKVVADFEDQIDRNAENNRLYARMMATTVRKKQLKPFDRSGVARVIEYAARLAEDAEKLTTDMRCLADLMSEADYWASQQGHPIVSVDDVNEAIDAQKQRAGGMMVAVHESIDRGMLLIDTLGEKVGQVNALMVVDCGDIGFGVPSRISARVSLGDGDVLDIEREVDMGGPLHSKGVMILSAFLRAHYAYEMPLALSASLVFEQSYGEVEGDSASSGELYALLSAIANVPIKQGLAVTGSVNQHGEIQAVGGVNEKIEGFFDVCKQRGVVAGQGVLIPVANVHDLMLRDDIVEAAAQGLFHIYPIATIDEGIACLTGLPAGELNEQGKYPEDSVNARVAEQVLRFALTRHEFGEQKKDTEDDVEQV